MSLDPIHCSQNRFPTIGVIHKYKTVGVLWVVGKVIYVHLEEQ